MTSVSELDLDLDVFQGPFDLLLAVLLREEISLAEVPLGEIVISYVDHLGETRRARPRDRHRVPRPDRGTLRAQVAAAAAARGRRRRAGPRGGRRRAARPDARVPPLQRGGEDAQRALRAGGRRPLPLGAACRRSCGERRSMPPPRHTSPTGLGSRSAICSRCRLSRTRGTSAPPSRCSGGSGSSASCSAPARRSISTTRSVARTASPRP